VPDLKGSEWVAEGGATTCVEEIQWVAMFLALAGRGSGGVSVLVWGGPLHKPCAVGRKWRV